MTNPFLTALGHSPLGSLNRVPLVDLPGSPLAPEWRGETSFPLISGSHLQRIVAGDWDLRTEEVRFRVRRLGGLLGQVLGILKTGPEEARALRREWKDEEWGWWAGVDFLALAGGCFRGVVGTELRDGALEVLTRVLDSVPALWIAPQPESLPLKGAWRRAERQGEGAPVLALDWGQTLLKAATFGSVVRNGSSVPVICPQWQDFEPGEEEAQAWELHRHLLTFTRDSLRDLGVDQGTISVSIGNYIEGGRIHPRGGYGKLRLLAEDYRAFFQEDLNRVTGGSFRILMNNDGVCASFAVTPAPDRRAALVLWGTALGIGWPR